MKLLIPILFLLLSTYGVLFGQWSSDPTINTPVCIAQDTQKNVRILPDDMGGAYIAWSDKRNGTWKIYMQHIDHNGLPLWQQNGIQISQDTSVQSFFDLTEDGSDGIYIAWVNSYPSGNAIFAQRITGNGNLMWSNKGVQLCSLSYNHDPDIITLDNSSALVTWKHESSDTNSTGIYCQKININGNIEWGSSGEKIYGSHLVFKPLIAKSNENNSIIVWEDWRNNNNCIYAQKIDSGGNILWNNDGVQITTPSTSIRSDHKIIANEKGGVYVVWENGYPGFTFDIYAQNIDSNGNRLWTSQGLRISTSGNLNIDASLIRDESGGIFVGWNYETPSLYYSVKLQRISSTGKKLWNGGNGVILNGQDSIYCYLYDGIVSDGNGGLVASSFDTRNQDFNIFGYKIDSTGTNVWGIAGVPISIQSDRQQFPKIIRTANGFITVWEDRRNGNYDIYCQKVNSDGSLTVSINQISSHIPDNFSLSQNYPNPFNPSTKISFDVPKHRTIRLSVYNSLGQMVASLVDEELSPGSYEYSFDGSGLSSGVYYYSIQTDGFTDTKKMLLLK